jgi:glycosyltransferase involved in cell wall biosynthesis
MDTPVVTILVPTYNRAHFLAECLDSVLGQTIPPAQVIVINDGSTDSTREVLTPYMDRIEYIEKENGGKSAALNVGLGLVKGDYAWIVDDDNVAFPDAIERLVAPLEHDPEAGFSYSSYVIATTRQQDNRIEPQRNVEIPDYPREEVFIRLLEGNFVPCPLVRTSCYREVGPYREDLVRSQDYEMALRLARRFRGTMVNGMAFYYRQHAGQRGTAAARFDVTENDLKWRENDQRIFRQLREELELSDYLPVTLRSQSLGAVEKRRAYLQRMSVMAARGMIKEMVEDLQHALSCPAADTQLSPAERDMVLRSVGYLWQEDLSALRRELAAWRLPSSHAGTEIKVEMARALYWRFHSNVRANRWSGLVDVVRTSGLIVGLRGVPAVAGAKLRASAGFDWLFRRL